MSAQTTDITARVGPLAARFARRTAERLAGTAPGPSAWAARLATRRGVERAMPRLTDSLHRLLAGAAPVPLPPKAIGTSPRVPGPSAPAALRTSLVRQGGAGEPLTSALRQRLHPHLKFDPVQARLHRGAAAAEAARSLKAEAFTIGPDVFFGAGRYAPETRLGLGLLAHELTHVGQQTAQIGDRMRFFTPHGGDAMESEAQQTAAEVLRADDRAKDDGEKSNRTGGSLHQAAAPPRPALAFSLSVPRTGAAAPAQMATEESGEPGSKTGPAQADARAVTDRVYELMKQEIALSRERGSLRRQ